MPERTFGWVQDATQLSKLRQVVEIVAREKSVKYSSLLPLVRRKLDIGRWADDNYVRFAYALNFIEYTGRVEDKFILSAWGQELLQALPGSKDEREIFTKGILSYPPAVRILDLLKDGGHLTKFQMGRQFGLMGEYGFTTFPEELFVITVNKDPKKRADLEGDSDKYVRTIARWLEQMGWVKSIPKKIIVEEGGIVYKTEIGHAYKITEKGKVAWRSAHGVNIRKKIPRKIAYEMLCSRKQHNYDYIRKRRVTILELLIKAGSKGLTAEEILQGLKEKNITITPEILQFDFKCFMNMGLDIRNGNLRYFLLDELIIFRPEVIEEARTTPDIVEEMIVNLSAKLHYVPIVYLDMIRCSFDPHKNKEFEGFIYELGKNIIGFKAEHLGGQDQPDVLYWYHHPKYKPRSYGIIIDAKERENGFSLTKPFRLQMKSYIDSYYDYLTIKKNVKYVFFLFVSSHFYGELDDGLNWLYKETDVPGSVISAENLIYLAEQIKTYPDKIDLWDIRDLFGLLKEISKDDIDNFVEKLIKKRS